MQKQILKTIFLASVFFMLPYFSNASNYYVSTVGSNTSGDGSIGNPWLTPEYGANNLQDGDTLLIREGVYDVATTAVFMKAQVCPAADNATIKSYPGEYVKLRGNGGVAPTNGVIGSFNGSVVRSGTVIDGLVIEGIVVMMGTGIVLKNSDVSVGGGIVGMGLIRVL